MSEGGFHRNSIRTTTKSPTSSIVRTSTKIPPEPKSSNNDTLTSLPSTTTTLNLTTDDPASPLSRGKASSSRRSMYSAGSMRSLSARNLTVSPAAIAAQATARVESRPLPPSPVVSFCYRGLEVIVSVSIGPLGDDGTRITQGLIVAGARTRVPLQRLEAPGENVIRLASNGARGSVIALDVSGGIFVYHPVSSDGSFGRYKWTLSRRIRPQHVFDGVYFRYMCVSMSRDGKVLLSDGDRMAVFDGSDCAEASDGALLWVTSVKSRVVMSGISGDGRCIACVLEGEGEGVPYPYGVRTYVRDGAGRDLMLEEESGDDDKGILYKSGPFLVHSYPVSRLSWRGGCPETTSGEDGNDLLLTHCRDDSTMRVFSQGNGKQLLHWTAPPGSRADWLNGISVANLGDLKGKSEEEPQNWGEAQKKTGVSGGGGNIGVVGGGWNNTSQVLSHQPAPSSAAGAWIAELTFRGNFPALRLSRLSYMKSGGDDFHPAHFESVAAILPPGSLCNSSVLEGDDVFSVQGLWPVWNPDSNAVGPNEGSHSPPSELRIVASQDYRTVCVMEFPLWGDKEFGAMEFGSPLKYLLVFSDDIYDNETNSKTAITSITNDTNPKVVCACLALDDSRLVARASTDHSSVSLTWRREGTMSLLPNSSSSTFPSQYEDISVLPLPLLLPSLENPKSEAPIVGLRWWPDENFGGPPRLFVLTKDGSLILYEMPPPWSALEPPLPSHDPFGTTCSTHGGSSIGTADGDFFDDDEYTPRKEYEVSITPHHDFGIGLRLEAQANGLPAVAGSYKKHPLSGGKLPAERCGMIILGDELLAVNETSLEGMSFEDIIASVRRIGATAQGPLRMKFRPGRRVEDIEFDEAQSQVSNDDGRRSIFPDKRPSSRALNNQDECDDDDQSAAASDMGTVMVGAEGEVQQAFCRIVAVVRDAVPTSCNDETTIILPWNYGTGAPDKTMRGVSLFVAGTGTTVTASRLEVTDQGYPDNFTYYTLGTTKLKFKDKKATIQSFTVVKTATEGWCLTTLDTTGHVTLLFISVKSSPYKTGQFVATFHHHYAFYTSTPSSHFLLTAHSVQLLATSDSRYSTVTVWLASYRAHIDNYQPNDGNTTQAYSKSSQEHYYSSVTVGNSLRGAENQVVDIQWLPSGNLDAFPWLLVFTRRCVILHRRGGNENVWTPTVELTYPPSTCHSNCLYYNGSLAPVDAFPHILHALRELTVIKTDETTVTHTDFHPDALIATLLTHSNSINVALDTSVKGIFNWLARWTAPEENSRPSWAGEEGIGGIVPWKSALEGNVDDDTLTNIETLRDILHNNGEILPTPLETLTEDEVYFLWVVGELLTSPPPFIKLDNSAQLMIFSHAVLDHISDNKHHQNTETDEKDDTPDTTSIASEMSASVATNNTQKRHRLLRRHDSFARPSTGGANSSFGVAHAAALSALVSSTQSKLIRVLHPADEKFDWGDARAIMLPFWLRSDLELRKIAEEMAQKRFKKTMSAMESALFYIALRKIPTLQNYARTDRSDSGRLLVKFLGNYDFASERGRKAAEKNAYSLLRKRQYGVAAAFFLLAEPPMLKMALEIIVTQMEDMCLAFFVARLVGSNQSAGSNGINGHGGGFGGMGMGMGMGIGGMGSFRGLSGFGGFNGPRSDDAEYGTVKEEKYDDWSPNLKEEAINLLEKRLLPLFPNDDNMKAIINIWLNRPTEATRILAGSTINSLGELDYNVDLTVPPSFDAGVFPKGVDAKSRRNSAMPAPELVATLSHKSGAGERVIFKTNTLIDFFSRSLILKTMGADKRIQWSASLHIGRAMSRRGLELPSVKALLQIDPNDILEQEKEKREEERLEQAALTATPKKHGGVAPSSGQMSSSIFKSFDAPPTRPKPSSEQMSSSIFDSFVAPPSRPKPKPASSSSGEMSSSIFDSFNAPSSRPKSIPAAPPSGEMGSSIFDSFDAPPPSRPKPKPVAPPSGEMSSSIFDSFNAPPPSRPKPKPAAPPSGEMSSSIFDTFNAPPLPLAKPKVQSASPSGDMSSSIFDSFNGPPRSKSTPENKTPSTGASSSLGGFGALTSSTRAESPPPSSLVIKKLPIPPVWSEWRIHLISHAIARRLLREMARVVSKFAGDPSTPPLHRFRRPQYALVPYQATEVLQVHCRGHALLENMRRTLEMLCDVSHLSEEAVVEQALSLIAAQYQPRRIVFAVLLHLLMERNDLAEDVIRDAAHGQMRQCNSFTSCNDDLVHKRKTMFHSASQYARRKAAMVSWQLELCLWLHRGECLPLSGIALKEAIIGVRVGILIAGWGRNHESIEALIKCEPDCLMDQDAGKQLWTNMKIINTEGAAKPSGVCSSGGWEFLVDCRREEATNMLRERKPGTFLLRPHPEDTGVFTLSFKTNLISVMEPEVPGAKQSKDEASDGNKQDNTSTEDGGQGKSSSPSKTSDTGSASTVTSTTPVSPRPVNSDDVVQHAIIRLSDAGFRCGSFGPFPSLMRLLETVSASLPFALLFNEPPAQGIIKEQGTQPSPNSFFLRKVALHSKSEQFKWKARNPYACPSDDDTSDHRGMHEHGHNSPAATTDEEADCIEDPQGEGEKKDAEMALRKRFGMFSQLLVLTEVRTQLSAIAAAEIDDLPEDEEANNGIPANNIITSADNTDNVLLYPSLEEQPAIDMENEQEELLAIGSRMVRPLLEWCRAFEILLVPEIAPSVSSVQPTSASLPIALACTESGIEAAPSGSSICGGDAVIRRMIQPGSGVEFRTLRVGEVGHSAIVVLFSKEEAVHWLIEYGAESDKTHAEARLQRMEKRRVIEEVNLSKLRDPGEKTFTLTATTPEPKKDQIRYRFVDPWEVEALDTREAGGMGATLGREHLLAFNLGIVARSCERLLRSVSGVHLMSLWATAKGGLYLTKAIASIHPPWERDVGVDLRIDNQKVTEPTPIMNSIRKHLYRNALFRRLHVPQRFLAVLQIELLDLKNLTSPGGTSPLTAYALLRLKRTGSSAPLTHKARTLDSAATRPRKICKTSGPNAPASWGSLVRFRFTLPEDVNCDGISFDMDREALFRGPPSVLQLSVYEKKFMSDTMLGGADVKLDALGCGDQLEEWVPLRAGKNGITWFARIRITLKYELLCLDTEEIMDPSSTAGAADTKIGDRLERCPSVGLRKLLELSHHGGAHEDSKAVKKSVSTPDFFSYLESMAAL